MKRIHSSIPARPALAALLALVLMPFPAEAAKFKSAKIRKTINDVKVLTPSKAARPASPGETISGSSAVQTGQRSRAELQFPDESLVRLGSNSLFSFETGKRDVELEKGTILMQVPKSLGRTQVKTAAVTAAITGTTILIEYTPPVLDEFGNIIKPGIIKIIVIEGSLEFALNIALGRKMTLLPGEMVAMPSNAKQLPKKFTVDLNRLTKTSNLFDGGLGPLPDTQSVNREVGNQNNQKRQGTLVSVNSNRNKPGRLFPFTPSNQIIRNARGPQNANPNNRRPPIMNIIRRDPPPNNNTPAPPAPVPLPDRPDRPPPGSSGGPGGPNL